MNNTVALLCDVHDAPKRFFESMTLKRLGHGLMLSMPSLNVFCQRFRSIPIRKFPKTRFAEFNGEGQHPMSKVSEGSDQLRVDFFHEIFPREICVVVFWHVDGQVVTEGVRIVMFEERREPNSVFSGLGELATAEHQVLHGRDVMRQCEIACLGQGWRTNAVVAHVQSEHDGRPNDGMKRDVVLTEEVQMARAVAFFINAPP